MAEPGLSEIATTTLRNRREALTDSITDNHPVSKAMKEHGSIEMESGGRTLVEEHFYDQNDAVMRYHGAQPLNTAYNPTMTAFEVDWKQFAGAMVINGREKRMNAGELGVIKLLDKRIKALEFSLKNFFEQDIISDGTADGGLQIGGLKYWISTTPTSGTVGGIDRSVAANAYARNFKFDTVNDNSGGAPGGAVTSASNIRTYLNWAINSTSRGSDMVDVLLQGQQHFEYLQSAMQAIQRITSDSNKARSGFRHIIFEGIPAVMCGGINFSGYSQIPTDRTYGVNCKHTKLRIHEDAYFEPLPKAQSVNQDTEVKISVFMGNMTCAFPRGNFVMFDS